MRSTIVGTAPVLTDEQVVSLNNFFHDVDEVRRRRVIYFIDRAVAVYNAMQHGKDKPEPVNAAKQVERINAAIQTVIKELDDLSADTIETFFSVAKNRPDLQETVGGVAGRGVRNQLRNVQALCSLATKELPEVGKRGRGINTGNKAGKILAESILEAYAVAYDRVAKRLRDDKSEVSEIYRILKIVETPGIIRQVIERTRDFK